MPPATHSPCLLLSLAAIMFRAARWVAAQDAMRHVVRGVGRLHHAQWRAFHNERKKCPARGFVDGDLVELFLDMRPEDQNKVGVGGGIGPKGRNWPEGVLGG